MKKLYIFDFDGTLLNTIEDSITCFNKALSNLYYPTYDVDDFSKLSYKDFRKFIYELLEKERDSSKREAVETLYKKYYSESKRENTGIYDGIEDMLNKLVETGVQIAICSNKDEDILNKFLWQYFPGFKFNPISGYEKGKPDKPDPARLNKIIEDSGLTLDEVLYIGDKDTDILTAQNASVDMVLVDWGQSDEDDLRNPYPIKVVSTPEEIIL